MQAKVWRCRICSEPYIGYSPPENCPFCGAHREFIIPGERWNCLKEGDRCRLQSNVDDIQLSQKSRENLKKTLEIEISNATFYLCVSKVSKSPFIQGMFKALSKVETEHAHIAARLLKAPKPVIKTEGGAAAFKPESELNPNICSDLDKESVKNSMERETRAVNFYTQFLKESKEPRLKEIFSELIKIESDHLALDKEALKMLGG